MKLKVALEISPIKRQLTPFEVYYHIKDQPFSFILDSGMDAERLGRYSFVGADPFAYFKSKGEKISIYERGKGEKKIKGSPFKALKDYLNTYKFVSAVSENVPPFIGGAVGYFSYDLGEQIEDLPGRSKDDLKIPDCFLAFYEKVFVYDHLLNKAFLCTLGLSAGEEKAKELAVEKMRHFKEEIYRIPEGRIKEVNLNEIPSDKKRNGKITIPKSNFTREEYCLAVERAKEYIAAGDIYQINLSQRFEISLDMSPLELYMRLRTLNPAPFAAYLDFGEIIVASSSPERFLRVSEKEVETRPIKGTRPRGEDPIRDEELKNELLNSEKDRAELVIIIDLERNDLGKVCMPGSVKVPELIILESYATVFHLVSTVVGTLSPDKDIVDLLLAAFPGGSITGAPKIRCMEIIDELEGLKRSIYTGSIGYISFNGNVDLNIVIRTFLIKNNRAYFQVGGGIVADSIPEHEYQETLDKAKALISSLSI